MSQPINTAEAVQYDRTLVPAIELSSKSWVLAAQVPGLPQTKAKRTIAPEKLALQSALNTYRTRAISAGHPVDRVVATYEAGWCVFWLARPTSTGRTAHRARRANTAERTWQDRTVAHQVG